MAASQSAPCEVAPFSDRPCSSGNHSHHILNRSLLGNPRALAFVDAHPEEFKADCCPAHNITRDADSKRIRALLLQSKVDQYGWDHMNRLCEELGVCYKGARWDLSLMALLAAKDRHA